MTILALGGLLYPMLTGAGYRERFSLGTVTASEAAAYVLILEMVIHRNITLPVGINLFIASLPFLAPRLIWLLVITYIPVITLWWKM